MEESKYLSVNNYGNVSVVENEKYEWGVIDHNGKVVVPFGKYGWIDGFESGLARVRTHAALEQAIGQIYSDSNGGAFLGDERTQAYFDNDTKMHPYRYSKWGIINEKGEEVVPLLYDHIMGFYGKKLFFTKVHKNGLTTKVYFPDLTYGIFIDNLILSYDKLTLIRCSKYAYGNISIPNTVEIIHKNAFSKSHCKNIQRLDLGTNLKKIGKYAFWDCNAKCELVDRGIMFEEDALRRFVGLKKLYLYDKLEVIPDLLCEGCSSLDFVQWPSSLKIIGKMAFRGSTITSIDFPSTLERIGDYTFEYCSALRQITIPKSIKAIGIGAFDRCPLCKIEILSNNPNTIEIDKNDYHLFDEGIYETCELIVPLGLQSIYSAHPVFGRFATIREITIPFQVDYIERREDGYYDVKVNKAWGVLDIFGREIVGIKYASKIPLKYAGEIVKNSLTGRYGILADDGSEKIPSIYDHLIVSDNFIYFGYDGYVLPFSKYNFFSNIEQATWGVMDLNGKIIINAAYDCYKEQDGFILAGRNGSMLYVDGYGRNYSGVYDLFTLSGELIFGGFSEFTYDSENGIYIFFLGGKWHSYSIPLIENEWNTIYAHDYKFVRGIGLWLFLDKDLKSIKRRTNGSQLKFKKGAICKIEIRQQENKNLYMYNIPIDIMAKGFSCISDNNIVIADCNNNESQKFAALNAATGEETPYYQKIEFIDKSRFYFAKDDKVGIRDYSKIIVNPEYLFITHPVNGFYFVAKEIDNRFSNLALRSLGDENILLNAIEKTETSKLINSVALGKLKIESNFEGTGLESIIFPKLSIFDNSFVEQVPNQESDYSCPKFKDIYWFANDYRMKEKDNSDD